MSHPVRRAKIGRLYDGSSCCCCTDLLFLDDDAVICEGCGSPTHIRCWDKVNRCVACNRAPIYVEQPLPVYTGPKLMLPEAKEALTFAIISLFCFGFVFGPIALVKGTAAKKLIAADPKWEGEGTATAAQVMGAAGTLLSLLYVVKLIFSA